VSEAEKLTNLLQKEVDKLEGLDTDDVIFHHQRHHHQSSSSLLSQAMHVCFAALS